MHKFLIPAVLAVMTFNANAVVLNTLDGVEYKWLELTETEGMSRDQVEVELLDVNSDLYGYEYASQAQVESLFLSYASWDGLTDGLNAWHGDPSVVAGVSALVADFGATFIYEGNGENKNYNTVDGYSVQYDGVVEFNGLYGLESECYRAEISCIGRVTVYSDAAGNPTMAEQSGRKGWDSENTNRLLIEDYKVLISDEWRFGSFLVTTVPVPASVWLFGSALAGLGWFRRRTTA